MKIQNLTTLVALTALVSCAFYVQCTHSKLRQSQDESGNPNAFDRSIRNNSDEMFRKGKAVFRFETFGDEVFWTDQLQLHKVIADEKHGGTGMGITPKQALDAGLKVDLAVLP